MKRKKQICVLLIVMFILSVAMVDVAAGNPPPQIFVNPPAYTATQLGEVFTIDINIANVSNLQAVIFKLGYNTTILDAIDVAEGPFMDSFGSPIFIFSINETAGYIDIQILLPYGQGPAYGNGTLATITFNATYYGPVSCVLDLYDTHLVNPQYIEIGHDVIDGYYQLAIFSLTLATDKYSYQPGENVSIYANLTLNGSPIEDGLVALEIRDPWDSKSVVRTMQATTTPPPGNITIVDLYPSDAFGNPDNSFRKPSGPPPATGDIAYFNVTVRNSGTEPKDVWVTVNPYDAGMVSIRALMSFRAVDPGETLSSILGVPLPYWAETGTGIVYANAFTDLPRNGGVPYCPEESATFQITDGASGAGAIETQGSGGNSTTGNYNLTFKLAPNAWNGIYRVYASSSYQGINTTDSTLFGVNVIFVPDDYPTIQGAVDAANSTINSIIVRPGTYNEHVTINKTLTLVGIDPSNTIINGSGTGTVVTVNADNVEISRFTIQNGGNSFPSSGIMLNNSSYCTVSENIILNNHNGIYLKASSQENVIQDNTLTSNNGYGILVDSSDNNYIVDNTLTSNNYGIYLNHSTNAFLRDNNMIGNKYNFGVFGDSLSHFTHDINASNTVNGRPIIYWVSQFNEQVPSNAGFVAIVSSANIVVRDLDLTKEGQGVLLAFTTDSLIERVKTTNNEYGIYQIGSDRNTIVRGAVSNNTVGIYQSYSSQNIVYHNNFTNNADQVLSEESANTWDDGYPSGGNYWSDHTGVDSFSGPYQNETGSDGIVDTPYVIDANNTDRYPLMDPWILVHDVAVTNVTPTLPYNASHLYPGWVITISATVKNEGDFTETFDVTVYYDNIYANTTTVTLDPLQNATVNLNWDTTWATPCRNYTISATATIAVDNDPNDNLLEDGQVKVTVLGDVDAGGDVNILDVGAVAWTMALGVYNVLHDLDLSGEVNILDVGAVAWQMALGTACP